MSRERRDYSHLLECTILKEKLSKMILKSWRNCTGIIQKKALYPYLPQEFDDKIFLAEATFFVAHNPKTLTNTSQVHQMLDETGWAAFYPNTEVINIFFRSQK